MNSPSLQNIARCTCERSSLPMIATKGERHLIVYANPAFCELVGIEWDALIDQPFMEVVPEGSANQCRELFERVYHSGQQESLNEQEHAHAGPFPIYWSYAVWGLLNPKNQIAGMMIQITDSTEMALFRRQVTEMTLRMTAINEVLLLSNVRQHELTEEAQEHSRLLRLSMKETNHRVKNNLQVVSALAEIQILGDSTTVPVSALERIALHAHSLSNLHDLLTQQIKAEGESELLDAETLLNRLLPLLATSIGNRPVHFEISSVLLTISQSSSLALLVSELVSNAFKHGNGEITVLLTADPEEVFLSVSDEGEGFPADFDPGTAAHTGLELILTITQHSLRGRAEFSNQESGGAMIKIIFPHSSVE